MNPSKFTYLIATVVYLVITASISYSSFKKPTVKTADVTVSVPTLIPNPTPTTIPTNTVTLNKSNPPPASTAVPTPKPQAVAPTVDNRCIIVVDGQKYDVTVFKNRHSGGDIFNCGTDMSAIFHQQHNQKFLNQMGPYKI